MSALRGARDQNRVRLHIFQFMPRYLPARVIFLLTIATLGVSATRAQTPSVPRGALLLCGDTTLLTGRGPDGEDLIPLSGKVRVSVGESWRDSAGNPDFRLTSSTVQVYSGLGPLEGLVYRLPGSIRYLPLGILSPGFGPSMIGPATASCPIDLPLGQTTLEVALGGHLDRYTVTLTDTTIVIQPVGNLRTTILVTPASWRIPLNSFWFECAADEARATRCQSTRRAIATVPGLVIDSFPASGWTRPYGPAASRRVSYTPDTGSVFSSVLSRVEELGWTRQRRCDDFYVQMGNSRGALYQFYGCRGTIIDKE
jgi:hypothetical protein